MRRPHGPPRAGREDGAVAAERLTSAPLLEILNRSADWLRTRATDSPRLDAELLVAHVLGVKRLDLYLQFERPLERAEIDGIRALVRRRGDGEPVAYLVGRRGFRDLEFAVDPRVLVPRPETEHLVEAGLAALGDVEAPWMLDVGTGSGCVAISVLHEAPHAHGLATDISAAAIDVATANAEACGVTDRLTCLVGDLLAPARSHAAWGGFHAVLSNPPYVVRGDVELSSDVAQYEPEGALYVPGDDALAVARTIAREARAALAPGGTLAMEVGHRSGAAARAMLDDAGYEATRTIPDYAGIERVVVGINPQSA